MRIQPIAPPKTAIAQKTAKVPGTRAVRFAAHIKAGAEATEVGAVSPAFVGMVAPRGIVALQQQEQNEHRHEPTRRHLDWAQKMIDELQTLRQLMLSGSLREDELLRIQARVKQRPHSVTDTQLQNLINDIEARAAVELAKLQR